MKRLTLLILLLFCLCACAAPAALPSAAPTSAATPAPAPTPEPTPEPPAEPSPEPTPEPPAAMAADGVHPRLIAHAGGAVYGYRFTNSLEALDRAYAAGFRFIELDFQRTSDGAIVLIHDWKSMSARLLGEAGQRSLEEFRAAEALAGLTLLDLDGLLSWMEAHPDCAIITDVKNGDTRPMLSDIREAAGDLAARFLPQAYSYEEVLALEEDGWERVILTLYHTVTSPDELRSFLEEHPLWAVTMSEAKITEALAAAVAESGTALYCHTINSLDFVDAWRDKGLTGVYTDYFEPKHMVWNK